MMAWAPKGVKIGPGTYFGGAPEILWDKYGSKLIIGNYTSVAAGVTFYLGGHHDIHRVSMRQRGRGDRGSSKGNIVIGSDCWIGSRSTILDGVVVGDGAVVGACAVVASDVPPYSVVVGNPARVVKYRFDEDAIRRLLAIRWWDWPPAKVAEAGRMLRSRDLSAFLSRYEEM